MCVLMHRLIPTLCEKGKCAASSLQQKSRKVKGYKTCVALLCCCAVIAREDGRDSREHSREKKSEEKCMMSE